LQRKAIQYLGLNSSSENRQVLNEIYVSSNDLEMKRQILQAFFLGGDTARVIEIATTEQNPDLRRAAVRQLGPMGSQRTGDALVTIYTRQTEPDIKRAVIEGLFMQNNAEALVSLARKEADREMQKRIVQQLSLMQSRVALEYMMELLNK
jgi:HEAT repeat protein